jgi:hypothetical protein
MIVRSKAFCDCCGGIGYQDDRPRKIPHNVNKVAAFLIIVLIFCQILSIFT